MSLPGDAVLLLSVVNMKLRDCYGSLDALCDDLNTPLALSYLHETLGNRQNIESKLNSIGYTYDEKVNQFV